MQNKHNCIFMVKKKTANLTNNNANFPNSAGTGTIPKITGKNTESFTQKFNHLSKKSL